jgi:hypothetical protein
MLVVGIRGDEMNEQATKESFPAFQNTPTG